MNYRVLHTTEYLYSEPVSVSQQLLHLLPRARPGQICRSARLVIRPEPATRRERLDYFGNPEIFCCLREPHAGLLIEANSEISVEPPAIAAASDTPPWERVRDEARRDMAAVEYAFDSPLVRTAAAYAAYAGRTFGAGRPILEALVELNERIHADFQYDPQATTVATPLEETFANRRGVCQDFVHVMIAALRSLGLPARYVSGYIRTFRSPDRGNLIGADASHAWVSAYLAGGRWVDLDPTNNLLVGTDHLTVAWGRDYADVAPVRGVIRGGGQQQLRVAVEVRAEE